MSWAEFANVFSLGVAFIAMSSSSIVAQSSDVDRWRSSFQPISITDSKLSGEGASILIERCRSSRYILFGEAHGIAGVAEMVTATRNELPQDPFPHLVLEAGDWFCGQLADGDDDVIDRFPYSLAFDYNGDLELIRSVKSAGLDREMRVMGIDQEACAIHPFGFLATNAKSFFGRQLSRSLELKALFLAGKYIRTDYQQDLDRLRARLGPDETSTDVVDSVSASMSIFVDHVNGKIQRSVEQREARMMRVFDEGAASVFSSYPDAKFVFKMGGAHTMRGIGPNGVKTLGQHVAEFAADRNETSLHISIYPWREDGLLPLPNEFHSEPYVLVDCKKLLDSLDSSGLENTTKLEQRLKQIDFIILMPNAKKASKSRIRQTQKSFVRSKLILFGTGFIPIVLIIPVYWTCFLRLIRRIRGKQCEASQLWMPFWISTAMVVFILLQLALLIVWPSLATPTSSWIVLTLSVTVLVALLVLVIKGFDAKSESKSEHMPRRYWLGVLGCVGLTCFIHIWGIGYLLGV